MPEETDKDWYEFALCQNMSIRWFYEDYENDPVFAKVMDGICLTCPVRALCLREGVENGEDGLWGGVYLYKGATDEAKNAHKTPEVWNRIRENL